MITFENITLQAHQQTLLKAASLHVGKGEKVVLCGTSGCGKSSLLRCAVGAIPLQSGTVRIGEIALSAQTVASLRSCVAFIGQEPILGAERVREALLLPFTFKAHRDHPPTAKEVEEQLARLHLPTDILEKPCARISGGEKQRVAIARALLLKKRVFLADEITSALDPESRDAVVQELFRPEITLLSVSHDSEWIANAGRRVEIVDRNIVEVNA